MIGFLYRLIIGHFTTVKPCQHKWGETVIHGPIDDIHGRVVGYQHTCRCEKCGCFRTFTYTA